MGNSNLKEYCDKISQRLWLNHQKRLDNRDIKRDYELPLIDDLINPSKQVSRSANFPKLRQSLLCSTQNQSLYSNQLEDFKILKLIGIGSFGKVFLVKSLKDKKLYAMKVLFKDKILKKRQAINTMNERTILEKMNCPFIVKLYYAFQDNNKLYLVTEFMQGGELFYFLKKRGKIPEKEVKLYAAEIILALEHLHKHNIIYRDLKPENILLDDKGFIKLTDFGLSKILLESQQEESEKAYTFCGTLEYLAPEVIKGNGYGKEVDWWSFGVVLYEMLTGKILFKRKIQTIFDFQNFLKPINISTENLTPEAKDILLLLLNIETEQRLTNITKIKCHPFFSDIDWNEISNKRVTHSYVPTIKSPEDVEHFDPRFTNNNKDFIALYPYQNKKKIKKINKYEFDHYSFVRKTNVP